MNKQKENVAKAVSKEEANAENRKDPKNEDDVTREKRKERKRSKSASDSGNGCKDKEQLAENVHSANAWEEVEMGDEDRKKKFLRLMGASNSKEHTHQGRFVIGDTAKPIYHTRAGDNVDSKTVKDLEHEFQVGVEHRDFTKRHCGLGFHGAEGSVATGNGGDVLTAKVSTKFDTEGNLMKESKPVTENKETIVSKKSLSVNFVKGSS